MSASIINRIKFIADHDGRLQLDQFELLQLKTLALHADHVGLKPTGVNVVRLDKAFRPLVVTLDFGRWRAKIRLPGSDASVWELFIVSYAVPGSNPTRFYRNTFNQRWTRGHQCEFVVDRLAKANKILSALDKAFPMDTFGEGGHLYCDKCDERSFVARVFSELLDLNFNELPAISADKFSFKIVFEHLTVIVYDNTTMSVFTPLSNNVILRFDKENSVDLIKSLIVNEKICVKADDLEYSSFCVPALLYDGVE
jgi:hypothetical protein